MIAKDLEDYKGFFPANPTPVIDGEGIKEDALRAILDYNIENGAGGFWLAGTTGEGPILSERQRRETAEVSADVCKGKVKTIMHVGGITTELSIAGAKAAKDAGCDSICLLPPFLYPTDEQGVLDFYKEVSDACDNLPFFVYNLPQITGVEFVPGNATAPGQVSMEKVIDQIPNVAGLKHSAANQAMIPVFKNMGLACFSGNGFLPLPSLTLGAVGTVDAPLSIIPAVYNALYQAWIAGDIILAQEKQKEVTKKVSVLKSYNSAADASKNLLSEILEIDCGRSIQPNRRLLDSEVKELITRAKEVGLI
ncbi:MAG: dihydrodipicolinate synthase family protein [Chloroflexota bacterium]|nr:dihydrodipicolinate synthase family protein [Chloroflexota bacterium]